MSLPIEIVLQAIASIKLSLKMKIHEYKCVNKLIQSCQCSSQLFSSSEIY